MTVNPGWGGQTFIAALAGQAARACARCSATGVALEVDGGIDTETAGPCARPARRCSWPARRCSAPSDPAEAYRAIAGAPPAPTERRRGTAPRSPRR